MATTAKPRPGQHHHKPKLLRGTRLRAEVEGSLLRLQARPAEAVASYLEQLCGGSAEQSIHLKSALVPYIKQVP